MLALRFQLILSSWPWLGPAELGEAWRAAGGADALEAAQQQGAPG